MSGTEFTEAELEQAVGRLADGDALRAAEARVATAAPALQRVLARALEAGGWFDETHRTEVERVAAIADDGERAASLDVLLAEETRIAMLVGVATGWALAGELGAPTNYEREES
ncbi:MAG: hypothetical protein EDQ89_12975 [Acidobacteria bacterium]|nr:MAG: hypothetical protein EDQ89_12975 [Acidobacteriota bacterium]MCL4287311.1 hypothetical protein [Thermoleophilia bacterium]GIK77781.1 MAG: hypothetical protein BroJett022_14710 [Actinomycetes bacterium]